MCSHSSDDLRRRKRIIVSLKWRQFYIKTKVFEVMKEIKKYSLINCISIGLFGNNVKSTF